MLIARYFFIVVAALAGWLICSSMVEAQQEEREQEGVKLAWKWNAGDKLEMVIVQDVSSTLETEADKKSSKNLTRTWITWEVAKTDDRGTATIESVVDRITMDSEEAGKAFKYDSDAGQEARDQNTKQKQTASRVAPMVGARTTQKISNRGQVQMVLVNVELEKTLLQIGGREYVKLFKDMSRNATLVLPKNGLKPGDSWDKAIETSTPMGAIKLVTTYTYQGEKTVDSRMLHQFDVAVKMAFANDAVTIDRQDTSGAIYFDAEAGRMDHSRVEQSIDITISMEGKRGSQSMTQVTTVNINAK